MILLMNINKNYLISIVKITVPRKYFIINFWNKRLKKK